MTEPQEDRGYTAEPTRVRIFNEETGDDETWHLDGTDNGTRYTECVERYASLDEALAAVPEFVRHTTEDHGVTWQWDTQRPHRARHITLHSAHTHCT